ncbi:aspartate/glutamate racemase family protein [Bosea caraganae]|uniref:Aspartate/glutamate racemase family protein n=1 Tax=Bosea caraganae TaxID=2763117 RepID=A0A370L690_9HYPH|nr:aspartate/glutamate racemase family protein [Bosea caraganae]RDJ25940.1 aspartate/glutamate racemase family protein [Bosea caraganae]
MTLGVLMLDTGFRRFPGDIGTPESFSGPVLFERVPQATAKRIVGIADDGFLTPFIAAGERLVERGATAITTSCGFLIAYQAALAAKLPVPVATSALLLIPTLRQMLPAGKRVGVVTFSSRSLSPAHLAAAGAPADTPIAGLPEGGAFQRAIFEDPGEDSFAIRETEAVAAAKALVAAHADIGALVLECTNLSPHRAAIAAVAGCPAYDLWPLVGLITQGRTRDARA